MVLEKAPKVERERERENLGSNPLYSLKVRSSLALCWCSCKDLQI
jgi:hypothetical protein